MTDTTELDDGPEVELDEVEEEELEDAEPAEDEESDEEADEEEPEPIEVEIGGKTYKVHPELRDSIMFHADYTRKTQEVAEQRKALEARITEVEEASEGERTAQKNLAAIEVALQSFDQVDWNLLDQQNPQEAQRLFRNFTLLQQQKQGAESELKEAREKREVEAKRVYAERFDQSMAELRQAVPGWGEPKAIELKTFAKEAFGFTDEEFSIGLHDPRQIRMLNMAFAASQANKPKKPAVQLKPATKVKGGSAPKKGLDDRLSTEEWMKRRQQQLSR